MMPPNSRTVDCVARIRLTPVWGAVVAACISAPGCSTCQQARRTTLDEPAEYSVKRDQERSLQQYDLWAAQAWDAYAGGCPPGQANDAFGSGFRDGFVDFVYAGGNGEPPPIPPRSFWNLGSRTPEGQGAADDWFAGYRAGARAARDGGYRQFAIVQSSACCDIPPAGQPTEGMMQLSPGQYLMPEEIPPSIEPVAPLDSVLPEPHRGEPAQLRPSTSPSLNGDSGAEPAGQRKPPPFPGDRSAERPVSEFQSALRSAATRGARRPSTSPGDSRLR